MNHISEEIFVNHQARKTKKQKQQIGYHNNDWNFQENMGCRNDKKIPHICHEFNQLTNFFIRIKDMHILV